MGATLIGKQSQLPLRRSVATGAWTIVLRGRFSGFETGMAAMERLCHAYFPAIKEFLIQGDGDQKWAKSCGLEFIAHLRSGNCLRYLRSDRTHFRHFLLEVLQTYLADTWRIGSSPLEVAKPIDAIETARRFERKWAMTAIERAMYQMAEEGQRCDWPDLYAALCEYLSGSREIPYQNFTATFGLSEGATKMALQRLRFRFGEFLRAEIRETVQSEELIFGEIQTLSEFAK